MSFYIREAQDRPFELLKKNILIHSVLQSIYEDFYSACLLLIQKNSSCTKEGGHLSNEDISLIEKRILWALDETRHKFEVKLSPFLFLMRFAPGVAIIGFLHSLLYAWDGLELPPSANYRLAISFLILGATNWLITFCCYFWSKRRVESLMAQIRSLFLRVRQAVEIQYKKVKTS
ncbi:hypothetical protein [Candidatus Similichlamydia epinepheli]|uniref:hypothetical protein n=1 Tax=Candidatus Similichlamydia epinepheli TaxID=1903953 RepID=UPI00130085D6|nr:hypothetical protein [Candidatus Similichlamydia epinepheli]